MKNLTNRQKELLRIIVEDYIETSNPVGSKQITEHLDLSSATIRNEMAELESLGYLIQPHISAGRIPTEEAYIFYVNNFLLTTKLSSSDEVLLADVKNNDPREYCKDVARKFADMFGLAVIVSFSKNDIYFTGVSGLFTQVEFKKDFVCLADFTSLLDHLEEKNSLIFDKLKNDINISIGSDNPFSEFCGSIIVKLSNGFVLSVVGPIRMDYARVLNCLNYIKEKISQNK
ncbi:MAG: HTH domain-containing protein [Patescibacteria group bacterium]